MIRELTVGVLAALAVAGGAAAEVPRAPVEVSAELGPDAPAKWLSGDWRVAADVTGEDGAPMRWLVDAGGCRDWSGPACLRIGVLSGSSEWGSQASVGEVEVDCAGGRIRGHSTAFAFDNRPVLLYRGPSQKDEPWRDPPRPPSYEAPVTVVMLALACGGGALPAGEGVKDLRVVREAWLKATDR